MKIGFLIQGILISFCRFESLHYNKHKYKGRQFNIISEQDLYQNKLQKWFAFLQLNLCLEVRDDD